jgi:hypothetical protein
MRLVSLLLAVLVPAGSALQAQPVQPGIGGMVEFIALGRIPGALYRPGGGAAPRAGIVYQNGGGSLTSTLCAEMSKRGFLVLCTTGPDDAAQSGWETGALNIKNAVLFLRKQPGIEKVILYGHSGGGAEASFYQAVAENGIAFCQDPKKLSRCPDSLAGLPPADAVLFPDAHPGLGVMDLRDINPSVVVDGNPKKWRVIPELDPFNPANGYKPSGSRYSREFQERYAKAQAARMNEIIDRAVAVRDRAQAGTLEDPAEQIVVIPAIGMAHLDIFDPTVAGTMSTVKPRKLLKNDGTIVTGIVKSVAAAGSAMGQATAANLTTRMMPTVKYVLSRGSVRANDSIDAIDYCTSNSVTVCNVGSIHVPVLFIASGAGTFIADEERMYERSPSTDKDFAVVEGADHSGNPCVRCETTPGQYSNSSTNLFAYIAKWINDRFPAVKTAAR